ncbi:MAG: hypothetical protein WC464_06675 [Bdellovibrionales bacterium]
MAKTFSLGKSGYDITAIEIKFARLCGEIGDLPTVRCQPSLRVVSDVVVAKAPADSISKYAVLAEMQEKGLLMQKEGVLLPQISTQPNSSLNVVEDPSFEEAVPGRTIEDALRERCEDAFGDKFAPLFAILSL